MSSRNEEDGSPQSRISRRDVLKHGAWAGAGVFAALSLPSVAQEAPQRGGVLTFASRSDPPNFDIAGNSTGTVMNLVGPCYNSLVMMDPADPSRIVGDLAEDWQISEDGLTYTFKLVENAVFHDGVPLTSADVKHMFDIVRAPPDGTISIRRELMSAIDQIDTPDDFTVVFRLKNPSPALLSTLAAGWFVVAPKHILEAKGNMKEDLIGSGPFMLKEYIRGVSIELVRNPSYHKPDLPYLDGIKIFIVPDQATTIAYLGNGQLHMYVDMPPEDASRVKAEFSDRVNVFSDASYNADPFVVNTKRSPFGDVRVRQAVAMAVDREQALKVIYGGAGVVGGLLPPGGWGLSPEELAAIPSYGSDIEANREEARRLLAEAGYPDGFDTALLGRRAASNHEERIIFLADQLGQIGIRARIDLQETATYLDLMNARDFDIAANTLSSMANDPNFYFGDYFTTSGALNYSGLSDPEIDRLALVQSQTMNEAERQAVVKELETRALNTFTMNVLYFKDKFVVASKRVNNFVMHPEPDNNRRAETWWMSDA